MTTKKSALAFTKTSIKIAAAILAVAAIAPAANAQKPTKVSIGMSGWTGYGPLTLADKAGIFKKHGLEIDIKMIPQKDRHLALASGAISCAATAVQSHVAWTVNGVPMTQIFLMDKSYGADGIAARGDITKISDLKGKKIAVSAPGTTPHFFLAWVLNKNGVSMKDVKTVSLEPQPAAQSFVLGQNDAAVSYEPYLSTIRAKPESGKIIATTVDYPSVIDTFGCTPKWLKENPKAAKALTESYFDAIEMIKTDEKNAYKIMGSAVRQTAEQFGESAALVKWAGRNENKEFFEKELTPFMKQASDILLESGIIRKLPENYEALADAQFIQ